SLDGRGGAGSVALVDLPGASACAPGAGLAAGFTLAPGGSGAAGLTTLGRGGLSPSTRGPAGRTTQGGVDPGAVALAAPGWARRPRAARGRASRPRSREVDWPRAWLGREAGRRPPGHRWDCRVPRREGRSRWAAAPTLIFPVAAEREGWWPGRHRPRPWRA